MGSFLLVNLLHRAGQAMGSRPVSGHDAVSRETLDGLLASGLNELGLHPSAEVQNRLMDFLALLLKWNRVYNLTAVRRPDEMVTLHLLDSLAVLAPMEQAVQSIQRPHFLDIGAGAGLPGLVLAIMHPDWQITLCDAVQKKAAFMTQVVGQLKLKNARALHERVEAIQIPEGVDAAVSRAFSEVELFASLASVHLRPGGLLFALQGKAQDRCPAGFQRRALHRVQVPGLAAERHLLVLDYLKG